MSKFTPCDLTEEDVANICSHIDVEKIVTVTMEQDSQNRLVRLEFVLDPRTADDFLREAS
jgi:hypothetical protein